MTGTRVNHNVVKEQAFGVLGEFTRKHDFPVELILPTTEEVMSSGYHASIHLPRSAMFKLWPQRHLMIREFVVETLRKDPYSADRLAVQAKSHLAQQVGEAATGTLKRADLRKGVITGIGQILVSQTDHNAVTRLEAVAATYGDDSAEEDNYSVAAALMNAQGVYIDTVASIHRIAHTNVGDQLRDEADYRDYARASLTIARGLALNPFQISEASNSGQLDHFSLLADQFTIPRN